MAASVKVMYVPVGDRAWREVLRQPDARSAGSPEASSSCRPPPLSTLKVPDSAMILRSWMIRIPHGRELAGRPAHRGRAAPRRSGRARRRRPASWPTRSPSRSTASTSRPGGQRRRSSHRWRSSCGAHRRASSRAAPGRPPSCWATAAWSSSSGAGGRARCSRVVALGRPSRLLARDVEVDMEALAAAALEAAAGFCRDLAAAVPGAARDARPLRAAVRRLARARPVAEPPARTARREPTLAEPRRPRRAGAAAPSRSPTTRGCSPPTGAGAPTSARCSSRGGVALRGRGRRRAPRAAGAPVPRAARPHRRRRPRALRGPARRGARRARRWRGPGAATSTLELDLARRRQPRTTAGRSAAHPLALAAGVRRGGARLLRPGPRAQPAARPRTHTCRELEAAAAERIAELDELAGGDLPRARPATRPAARAPAPTPALDGDRSAPGGLRRLSFRSVAALEVGAPARLALRGRAASWPRGAGASSASTGGPGRCAWRARGASLRPRACRGWCSPPARTACWALAAATGGLRWERDAPGRAADRRRAARHRRTGAARGARAPSPALDPATGETAWRFLAPGRLAHLGARPRARAPGRLGLRVPPRARRRQGGCCGACAAPGRCSARPAAWGERLPRALRDRLGQRPSGGRRGHRAAPLRGAARPRPAGVGPALGQAPGRARDRGGRSGGDGARARTAAPPGRRSRRSPARPWSLRRRRRCSPSATARAPCLALDRDGRDALGAAGAERGLARAPAAGALPRDAGGGGRRARLPRGRDRGARRACCRPSRRPAWRWTAT